MRNEKNDEDASLAMLSWSIDSLPHLRCDILGYWSHYIGKICQVSRNGGNERCCYDDAIAGVSFVVWDGGIRYEMKFIQHMDGIEI